MAYGKKDLESALELLPSIASRDEINSLLREKGIAFSASNWESFLASRLRPAIEDGQLTVAELVRFMGGIEEYGRQHVFLYRIPKTDVPRYLSPDRLAQAAATLGAPSVSEEPRVLDQPDQSTIGDVRIDRTSTGTPRAFVVKVVETRVHRVLLDTRESTPTARGSEYHRIFLKEYGEKYVRAVNVVQLNSNAILEVRIQRHESALDYKREAAALLMRLKDLIPPRTVSQYPISNAKANLWRKRSELRDRLEPGTSQLRDTTGAVMTIASGSEQGTLLESAGACDATDKFLAKEGSFEKADWRVLREDDSTRDGVTRTHLLLGELNEMTIPGQCSREDHENALDLIIKHNGSVSG